MIAPEPDTHTQPAAPGIPMIESEPRFLRNLRIQRGKILAQKPNYPDDATLEKVSRKLAGLLSTPDSPLSGSEKTDL